MQAFIRIYAALKNRQETRPFERQWLSCRAVNGERGFQSVSLYIYPHFSKETSQGLDSERT